MGKVHSIFNMSGKIGDYVFYELNGQQIMRKAPSKKKGPKTRAQQNLALYNKEFAMASSAAKMLRIALLEECTQLRDSYLYQRVSQLMLRLKGSDEAPVGLRTIQGGLTTQEGQYTLANFHFQKLQKKFPKILKVDLKNGYFSIEINSHADRPFLITELQINFETGKFRRADYAFSEMEKETLISFRKGLRHQKGFTDLIVISGEGFLQAVPVSVPKTVHE